MLGCSILAAVTGKHDWAERQAANKGRSSYPPGVSPRSERNLKSRRGGVKGADDIWMVDLIPRKESVDLQVGLRDTGNEGVILHNHNTPD